MKWLCMTLLLLAIPVAIASRPKISMNVREGSFSNLYGWDPTFNWKEAFQSGELDIEYGVGVAARATKDVRSLPQYLWAKVSKNVRDWGVSTGAKMELQSAYDSADMELCAENKDLNLEMRVLGTVGSKFCWPRLELSKLFHLGQYTVGRRILYNTGTRETQAVLGLEKGGTMVEVTAGLGGERAFTKSIKISQLIDENNMITPMVSADNTLSLQWARSLKGGNLVTTTFTPNDSVLILWKDGPWIANIAVSLNGLTPLGSNISVTRELNF